MKIIVIGGGAAGFFSALSAKVAHPSADVHLFERTAKLLSKVRISGGGRCNVTHACFDPRELVKNYPRGSRELLGPFHQFGPQDTIDWFAARGVELKVEADGRMFPITDRSSTIIDCFLNEAKKIGVKVLTGSKLRNVTKTHEGFEVDSFVADRVILATGSAPGGWEIAKSFGHTVIPPVPSLFTFNIKPFSLVSLAGVSIEKAKLKIKGGKFEQEGPLLITHWGFSGPAALKLSALEARFLAEKKYRAELIIDWLPDHTVEALREIFLSHPTKKIGQLNFFPIPKSLWKVLCEGFDQPIGTLGKKALTKFVERLKHDQYAVEGKTTNKEEFVTCGGVALREVNFKTMESKLCPGLFFCGEVLNIDGVTGGFNFQNAWTTGYIAGNSI